MLSLTRFQNEKLIICSHIAIIEIELLTQAQIRINQAVHNIWKGMDILLKIGDDEIKIIIIGLKVHKSQKKWQYRLAIDAPKHITVDREEVYLKRVERIGDTIRSHK